MRAALYLRVSSEEQARDGMSLDGQASACADYSRSQRWSVAGRYVDDGYSAKSLDRPALGRLLADARRRAFDVVLVWRLDRLSRRQRDVLTLIEDEFEPHGIGLKSVTEAFETTTPAGKAMVGMLSVFAQLEREVLIERVTMGHAESVKTGRWNAGQAPFGYALDGGRLVSDPVTAPIVRDLFGRAAAGESTRSLAAWLDARGVKRPSAEGGRWLRGTVAGLLRNRTYLGEMRWRGAWVAPETRHDALLSVAEWDAAQAALGTRAHRPSARSLLAGIAHCARCGARLRLHRNRGRRGYYACVGREAHNGCDLPPVDEERADALVLCRLSRAHGDRAEMAAMLGDPGRADPDALRREEAELSRSEAEAARRAEGWLAQVEDGDLDMPALRAHLASLEARRQAIGERRRGIAAMLATSAADARALPEVRLALREFARDLPGMDAEARRAVVHQLLERADMDVDPETGPVLVGLRLRRIPSRQAH